MDEVNSPPKIRGNRKEITYDKPFLVGSPGEDLKAYEPQALQVMVTRPRGEDTIPPDPLAEQKKKEAEVRGEIKKKVSLIVNNDDLLKRSESVNPYVRLGVDESVTLDGLKVAYDIVTAALTFTEDTTLLIAPDASTEERITYNKLQKLKTKSEQAFAEIKKKIEEYEGQIKEAKEILKRYGNVRARGDMFSQVLGVNKDSTKVQITGAYGRFIADLDRSESFFASLTRKRMNAMNTRNGVTLSEVELKDLELNDSLKAQHIYFNQLFDMMTNMSNEFRFRDTRITPENQPSQTSEQKATPPRDEASKLKGVENAFNDFMQEIIAKPQGKNVNTIIIELRTLIAHNPTHFHLYADDLSQIESMWKQIQYNPEKWTREHIDIWLPNIRLSTIREAMSAVLGGTVESSKANEGEATKKFGNDFIARSRLGYDNLLAFLDKHANTTTPDADHTKKTINAAAKISSVLKSMSKEMIDVGFLDFHAKFSDKNIITILSNELKYLENDFDTAEEMRNICSDLLEKKAEALKLQKVTEFITSYLQNGRTYDENIESLKDHVTKHPIIRAAWDSLRHSKSAFSVDKVKENFLAMSQADIDGGRLADYDRDLINWDAVPDRQLRIKLQQYFLKWAESKQKEWLKDIDKERAELAQLLNRQVNTVIPLYVESAILESNAIQSAFSPDEQKRVQLVLTGRLKSSLDNQLKFIDASIKHLSPSAVNKSLNFVKAESRFNAVSAQTIIQSKLKFEFADDEQLGKKSIGKIDRSDKLAPLLHSALNRISRSLYTELSTIKKAAILAVDTHGRILQHPTIFADSDYGAYSPGSGEKDDAFEIRRKAALRDNMISLLLTRLIAKKDPPLKNLKIRKRVETMTTLGLDQAIYFNIVPAEKAVEFIEVRKEAEAYLIELGFTQEELDAIDKNLMISAEKQSLMKAVNKYLLDEGMPENKDDKQEEKKRKIELLDPDLVVEREKLEYKFTLGQVERGEFSQNDLLIPILGKEDLWSKKTWATDTRLESGQRVQRIQEFLQRGYIEYDLTGTIDSLKRVKSGLGKRTDKLTFTLKVPLGDLLTPMDKTLIEAMARDTTWNQKDILNRIQEKLQQSEKAREFVKKFNSFIATQVMEAVKDPDAYLMEIGLTPNKSAPLTPEGWLNIFYNIGVGRFGELGEISRYPSVVKLYGLKLSGRKAL